MQQSTPTLRKIADRSYTIESDVDDAIELFHLLFNYVGPGKPGDLFWHRWRHDGLDGRTTIILFSGSPPRLSVLGPRLDDVDALVSEVQP